MTTPTTLGSLLLSSTDPKRLHAWYATVLPPKSDGTEAGYTVLDYGGFYVFIDSRDDVGDRNPEPGRIVLNFDVADARAAASRMDANGATWLSPLEDRDGSYFGTVVDPDGNYVQIVQLSAQHREAVMATNANRG